ncbi:MULTISPECIES: type II secretion system protein GspM [unclassified Paludibacterium]|uniref:type II secretion system protein GspM n=1 Tax=unclassified Paludibacterium TaxID=2618429 RepID=UPI001C04D6F1|nr:type II secretion system protein GspM [Paludibacterium sp. B53371]BEV73367.1 hypothetical protein THUN1379_28490 [Paludibacterium sp. THUN1379]
MVSRLVWRRPRWLSRAVRPWRLLWPPLALLLLLGLQYGVWRGPLWQAVQTSRQVLIEVQGDAARLQAVAQDWQALRGQSVQPSLPLAQLPERLAQLAEAQGLDHHDWQWSRQADGVRLAGRVAFDGWLHLLAELQQRHAVRVSQLRVQAVGSGLVEVDAVFSGARP